MGKKVFWTIAVRKRQCVAGLLIFAGIFLCAAAWLAGRVTAVETFAIPLHGKVVVIDPGHGGFDSGASANGVVEKEINLKIAHILQKYIEAGGGTAILTRNDDVSTADPNRGEGVSQKTSDLKERKLTVQKNDADMFISIHMNKFGQSQYKGAQVFFSENGEESGRLGETIQETLRETLDKENGRRAKAGGSIYVLKDTVVPSVLVECGFLSNADEAELLATEEYQRRVAWGIYVGMIRFFDDY